MVRGQRQVRTGAEAVLAQQSRQMTHVTSSSHRGPLELSTQPGASVGRRAHCHEADAAPPPAHLRPELLCVVRTPRRAALCRAHAALGEKTATVGTADCRLPSGGGVGGAAVRLCSETGQVE